MNNCESCGSPLLPGAFFCGECGNSTRSRSDATPAAVAPPVTPPPSPVQPSATYPTVEVPDTRVTPAVEPPTAVPPTAAASRPAFAQPVPAEAPSTFAPPAPAPTAPQSIRSDLDDNEATIIATRFTFTFSNGDTITVATGGLLGRNPAPSAGEAFDHLIIVTDPDRTVSKTHLEFGVEAGALWINDRQSGNGTTIDEPGKPSVRLIPGRRYPVLRGSRVGIGEQSFTVS